ncbi:hypothetical protein Tco_1138592, partial [Tanacetum coccineum]
MDLRSFICSADPTKVRIGERQCVEDEPKLLDTTVGCVVPLLPIAHARAESELDESVDKLFNESGSGNQAEQGDSASGGHGVGIQLVSEAAETVVKDAAPSLLNTPPFFYLCLGDLERSRLILENTIVLGLRERLDL